MKYFFHGFNSGLFIYTGIYIGKSHHHFIPEDGKTKNTFFAVAILAENIFLKVQAKELKITNRETAEINFSTYSFHQKV